MKANRTFLIVMNTAVIVYTILEYFYLMITHRSADKGVIILIVAVVLLTGKMNCLNKITFSDLNSFF